MQKKLVVSPSPFLRNNVTTRGIMLDVIIALLPTALAAIWYFGGGALSVILTCVIGCVLCEWAYQKLTHQPSTVGDLSAIVTGLLLAFNMPASAPWWMGLVGSVIAIVLVKQIFGGIGQNFMNPALAARTILMLSWTVLMAANVMPQAGQIFGIDATTKAVATPVVAVVETLDTEATSEATSAATGETAVATEAPVVEATTEATTAATGETAVATAVPVVETASEATSTATGETAVATAAPAVEATTEATSAATGETVVEATTEATSAATGETAVEATTEATSAATGETVEATTEATAEATAAATSVEASASATGTTVEATSIATPLSANASGYTLWQLFSGNIPGMLGETCKLTLLLGGIYLILRRVIDWRIPLSFLGTAFILFWIQTGVIYSPESGSQNALYQLLSGGLFLGAFFMATDYVTSPVNKWGRVIMGIGCALVMFVIRFYNAGYPEGCSFAILFMNVLTPLIDRYTARKPFGYTKPPKAGKGVA